MRPIAVHRVTYSSECVSALQDATNALTHTLVLTHIHTYSHTFTHIHTYSNTFTHIHTYSHIFTLPTSGEYGTRCTAIGPRRGGYGQ